MSFSLYVRCACFAAYTHTGACHLPIKIPTRRYKMQATKPKHARKTPRASPGHNKSSTICARPTYVRYFALVSIGSVRALSLRSRGRARANTYAVKHTARDTSSGEKCARKLCSHQSRQEQHLLPPSPNRDSSSTALG